MKKLWKKIKKWFRKHFGKRKSPNPVSNFTVEIEQ
jgi:hypothetical protein